MAILVKKRSPSNYALFFDSVSLLLFTSLFYFIFFFSPPSSVTVIILVHGCTILLRISFVLLSSPFPVIPANINKSSMTLRTCLSSLNKYVLSFKRAVVNSV